MSQPVVHQGRWEYSTFSESLGNVTYKDCGGLTIDGSLPDPRLIEAVERGVKRLLERVAPEGWEPVGPIDPNSLARAGHVIRRGKFRESWSLWRALTHPTSTIYDVTLFEVRLDCRRWVTRRSYSH